MARCIRARSRSRCGLCAWFVRSRAAYRLVLRDAPEGYLRVSRVGFGGWVAPNPSGKVQVRAIDSDSGCSHMGMADSIVGRRGSSELLRCGACAYCSNPFFKRACFGAARPPKLGVGQPRSLPVQQAFEPRVPRKPLVIEDGRSIGLPGSDHLYAAMRVGENIIKVGVSKDVLERLADLSRNFQGKYELLAVWPGEAALEEIVLDKLKPFRAQVSTSREHFSSQVTLERLCEIVEHARDLYRIKLELDARTSGLRMKESEYQEELQDRVLKRKREEVSLEGERVRIQAEKIFQDLVREKHPEAVRVFIERSRSFAPARLRWVKHSLRRRRP